MPAFWIMFVFCLWSLYYLCKKTETSDIAVQATFDDCDADGPFNQWFRNKPGRYVGDDHRAQEIVRWKIHTYTRFLETHGFKDETNHLDWLKSLLSEHNPKPPRKKKKGGASSFVRRR